MPKLSRWRPSQVVAAEVFAGGTTLADTPGLTLAATLGLGEVARRRGVGVGEARVGLGEAPRRAGGIVDCGRARGERGWWESLVRARGARLWKDRWRNAARAHSAQPGSRNQ